MKLQVDISDLILKEGSAKDRVKLDWSGSVNNPTLDKWYPEIVEGNRKLFVIYYDNELIGEVWILKKEGSYHLMRLGVREEYRNQGVGTWIISQIEDYIINIGESEIYLGVEKDNIKALSLYQKLGYEIIAEKKDSWKERDPNTGKEYIYKTDVFEMRKTLVIR